MKSFIGSTFNRYSKADEICHVNIMSAFFILRCFLKMSVFSFD